MLPRQQRGGGLTTITTLVISNLNDTVSRNDIYELCSAVGPLENVNIIAPGVAEITYRHKDDALEAFKKYHQRNLDGMPMVCHLQSGGGGRGRGSMGGVYSGGSRMGYTPYQSEHPMYSGGGSIHQSTGAFY
jgi:RNA recognition motif-containing protein